MTGPGRYGKHRPPGQEGKNGCLSALPLALLLTVKAMLAERRSRRG